MKRLNRFLPAVHSLPEEVRKIFAAVALALFSTLILASWLGNASRGLRQISLSTPAAPENTAPPELSELPADAALGPAAGIAESFRSLAKILPEKTSADNLESTVWGKMQTGFSKLQKGVGDFAAVLISETGRFTNQMFEGLWKKIYNP